MNDHAGLGCLVALLGFAIFTGCGDQGCKTVPVSGRITLDGQPLANARVTFQPIGKGNPYPGPGSFGVTDADGRFRLQIVGRQKDGAVVGPCAVRIGRGLPDKERATADTDHVRPRDASMPPQADDGSLHFDVPAGGTSAADFALTSPKSSRHR